MKSLSGEVTCLSLCLSLSVAFAHSACIPSGTQEAINRVLEQGGPGARAVLCPGARFDLTGTVKFTADNQEIYTEGLPTDSTRARLVITGRNLTGAVNGLHKSGVKLRNVIIDGGRSRLGYRSEGEGWALITLGGTASGQVVEYVKAFDTRSWSILQIAEGDTTEGSRWGLERGSVLAMRPIGLVPIGRDGPIGAVWSPTMSSWGTPWAMGLPGDLNGV